MPTNDTNHPTADDRGTALSQPTDEMVTRAAKVLYESECGPGYETSVFRECWDRLAAKVLTASLNA